VEGILSRPRHVDKDYVTISLDNSFATRST